jgi:hypothetical protein
VVDKTSDIGNIIIFPLRRTGGVLSIVKSNAISSIDSSNSQDLAQIAQAIFIRMTKAAEALVKDDSSANFKKLKEEADFLLTMEMALGDKMLIFKDLDLLCKQQKQSSIQAQAADSQQANSYVSNQLKILLEILQTSLRISSLDDWGDGDDNDLRALHAVPRNMEQPAWSRELFSILTKTTVPESGRIMVYDNLAGFYEHHLNMFRMHKKQEPYWNIVETATFVLDIADEEFRQEKEYDENEFLKAKQPQMPKRNALKLNSLDPFTKKRLTKTPEEKYNTDSEITLRTNFKKIFLRWIEINLQDFQEAGLGGSPLKIFNELCVSAKKGQALRQALG